MEFSIKRHPYFDGGVMCRINFSNGCGISIISGLGAYCDDKTFEIAPLFNDDLENIDVWGDQVKGYVTPGEISKIVEFAETHTKEEYKEFLENFEFSGKEVSPGEVFVSVLETMRKVAEK